MQRSDVAWICGGLRGIGRSIATKSIALGMSTYVSGREHRPDVGRGWPEQEPQCLWGDLGEREVADSQVDEIARAGRGLGSLFFAVHRRFQPAPFDQLRWSDFIDQFEGSVRPVFNVVQSALERDILGAESAIVVLSSVTVEVGSDSLIPRSASKGALEALVRSLGLSLAIRRVRVNGISVGWTDTEQLEQFQADGGMVPTEGIPLKRVASVEEIADVAMFLGTPASSYMTGTVLPVAGGLGPNVR